MFIAWSKKDRRTIVAGDNPEYLSKYRQDKDLYCPYTKIPVTYKAKGKDGRKAHFAIYPSATDTDKKRFNAIYNNGKSQTHIDAQQVLSYKIANGRNKELFDSGRLAVYQEYPIGSDEPQRADLAVIDGDRITVHEVQLSAISLSELQRRTELYLKNGVAKIYWYFKDNIMDNKTNDMKTYLISMGCGIGFISIRKVEKRIVL